MENRKGKFSSTRVLVLFACIDALGGVIYACCEEYSGRVEGGEERSFRFSVRFKGESLPDSTKPFTLDILRGGRDSEREKKGRNSGQEKGRGDLRKNRGVHATPSKV